MKLNRTTLRTVDILKLVSKKPDGITLDEICEKLKLPKTSAYDIVTTLVHTGMIHVARGAKQRYTIGLTAYRVGINYTNNLDFISTIEPVLKAFAREIGKTVFFGVRSDDAIVYICKYEPENPIITTATVGTKNPLYCTSLGKAIMAYTEGEEREALLERMTFERQTEHTLTTREAFEAELAFVRERGYAFDARELEDHMQCVGSPVFGQDGTVMGAISVSSLYKPSEDYHHLGEMVHEKAKEISRLLGYIGKL